MRSGALLIPLAALMLALCACRPFEVLDGSGMERPLPETGGNAIAFTEDGLPDLTGTWVTDEDSWAEETLVIQDGHIRYEMAQSGTQEIDYQLSPVGENSWYVRSAKNYEPWLEAAVEDVDGRETLVLYTLGFATDDGGGYFRDNRLTRTQ